MPNILCRKVSFGYDGTERNVFTNLDLVIDTGSRTALTGRNGRGKTTLLRLIHDELAPDRGHIECPVATRRFPVAVADATIPAFEVAKDAAGPFRRWEREMSGLLEGHPDEAALARYGTLQTRFQEAGGYEIDADLHGELSALDLDPSHWTRPFDRLSGGERTRCLLAGLFVRSAGYPLSAALGRTAQLPRHRRTRSDRRKRCCATRRRSCSWNTMPRSWIVWLRSR